MCLVHTRMSPFVVSVVSNDVLQIDLMIILLKVYVRNIRGMKRPLERNKPNESYVHISCTKDINQS